MAKYIVKKAFRDSAEHVKDGVVNRYEVGVDVSDMDSARLASLEKRGLVSVEEETPSEEKKGKKAGKTEE